MRILLVNKYWYYRGGAEKVVFLTKELLEKAGHDVEIFGMHHPKNILTREYFTDYVDYNETKGLKKISDAWKIIYNNKAKENFQQLVEKFQPDVVHFHNIYHQLSFSLLDVIKEKNLKSVMTLHDYKMICPNYNLYHHGKVAEDCMGGKYYKCLLNNCLGNVGASMVGTIEAYFVKYQKYQEVIGKYLSPSKFLKEKFLNSGFIKDKIEYLPNPINLQEYNFLENPGYFVAYVGRLSKEKGVENILDCAKKTLNIPYKIIGTGPLEEKLKLRINKENITNVSLEGYKTGQELKEYFTNAKIILLPSVWYENNPLSVLEAKAMGKIVLASNIGGLPEILPQEMLFEANNVDEMAQLIQYWFGQTEEKTKDAGLLLRSSVVTENSAEKYLEKLVEIYKY